MISPQQFAIVSDRGLERVAIPKARRAVMHCAIDVYRRGTTPKSRLAYALLRLGAWSGTLTRIPGIQVGRPRRLRSFDLDGWLAMVSERLGHRTLFASVAFPPKADENRFVAYLVTAAGRSAGFAKISRDALTDRQIANEIRGLKAFSDDRAASFSVPPILDSGIYDRHAYLILNPLPAPRRRGVTNREHLERILVELAAPFKEKRLEECSWRPRLDAASASVEALVGLARERQKCSIPVTRAHGDFGCGNTWQVIDEVYLFDWEEFCGDAPRFTDWFTYILPLTQIDNSRPGEISSRYEVAFGRIQSHYPKVTHWDLGLAVLLLSTQRNWIVTSDNTRALSETIRQRCQ